MAGSKVIDESILKWMWQPLWQFKSKKWNLPKLRITSRKLVKTRVDVYFFWLTVEHFERLQIADRLSFKLKTCWLRAPHLQRLRLDLRLWRVHLWSSLPINREGFQEFNLYKFQEACSPCRLSFLYLLLLLFFYQVDKILKVIPRERRTFLFSATMTKKVSLRSSLFVNSRWRRTLVAFLLAVLVLHIMGDSNKQLPE